jgi:hypothetical protein
LDPARIHLYELQPSVEQHVVVSRMWIKNFKLYTEFEIMEGDLRGRKVLTISGMQQPPERG